MLEFVGDWCQCRTFPRRWIGRCNTMIFFFVLKPLGESSSDLYFYQIDDFGTNSVGSLTQMNVSYASAFLVARLAALCSFRCIGPVALFNGVSSLSVDMLKGVGASSWYNCCLSCLLRLLFG